jgi:pimeloyl-ACP methyl ester carboxylesterase
MSQTTEFVTSRDGTRIGFDRLGEGPAIILVGGAMQFRAFDPTTVSMATDLAAQGFTVINYDRRGRGDSAKTASFTLEDTIDDLRALIGTVGGEAALFGNSSGGAICLAAAAAGLPISQLVLFEVPLDTELGDEGATFLNGLRERIAAGDREGTVAYFMKDMPPEWLDGAKHSPGWPIMVAMGPSLEPDAEALAWAQTAPRTELWASVTQPTLVLVGESTQPIMKAAAESIVTNLADARFATIEGSDHGWAPDRMASTIGHFLSER